GTQKGFASRFPQRSINVGIAEQNMIGIAAGLAASGKIPYAGTFAVFLSGRAWDQIRQSIAYPRLNVKLIGAHGGMSVGEDGATHQASEDLALMRTLPNLTVLVPCDAEETRQAVRLAWRIEGPVYIRLFRPPVARLVPEGYRMEVGKAAVLRPGTDVTLLACGVMVGLALEASDALAQDAISAGVLTMSSLKPLDREAVLRAAQQTRGIVTVEDHTVIGGLGSAVAEVLAEAGLGPLTRIGIPDCFGESGDHESLFRKYGLSVRDIAAAARKMCGS
ncbi:MAG: transketolase C-terminal domain-containing protein, partial [candidate division NC10 bacterium]